MKRKHVEEHDCEPLLKRCRDAAIEAVKDTRSWSGLLPALQRAFELAEHPMRTSQKYYRTTSSIDLGLQVEDELAAAMKGSTAPRHRVTQWLIDFCAERKWRLIAAQVPLIDPVSRVRTRMDFLAHDEVKHKLVVIELKTGYDSGYRARLANKRPRLLHINMPDSHETRHVLQLAWMDWVLEKCVGVARDQFYSCIVRVANDPRIGVRAPKPLPAWALKKRDYIVGAVRARQAKCK